MSSITDPSPDRERLLRVADALAQAQGQLSDMGDCENIADSAYEYGSLDEAEIDAEDALYALLGEIGVPVPGAGEIYLPLPDGQKGWGRPVSALEEWRDTEEEVVPIT